MNWHEGEPPNSEMGIFFVRKEISELGCKRIQFGIHTWYGDRWMPLRYNDDKITHYAYIDDPLPLEGNNFYDDDLGRMECVVQGEILPDLSTPPIVK